MFDRSMCYARHIEEKAAGVLTVETRANPVSCGVRGLWMTAATLSKGHGSTGLGSPSAHLPRSFPRLPVPTHNFGLEQPRFGTGSLPCGSAGSGRGDTAIVVMLLARLGVRVGSE